jgi:LPS export ABC transporter protein LptC
MVLKIEYILIAITSILILSIIGINPSSKPAINSKGNKEVVFKDFSLFELKVDALGRKVFAHEATKYQNYLDLKDINISDAKGHNILAKRAIYEDDNIFMKDEVVFSREDGLTFTTENLSYDLKEKFLETNHPFILDFNGSTIQGMNLKYNLQNREINIDEVEASILTE